MFWFIFRQARSGASQAFTFGRANLKMAADLPVLTGFTHDAESRVKGALKLISDWEREDLKLWILFLPKKKNGSHPYPSLMMQNYPVIKK